MSKLGLGEIHGLLNTKASELERNLDLSLGSPIPSPTPFALYLSPKLKGASRNTRD